MCCAGSERSGSRSLPVRASGLVDALLPPDRGFYLTSAVLTTAVLVAFPLWAGVAAAHGR